MKHIHIAPKYFFSPTHPITVAVIGVGGTGSLMLSRLARIDFALKQLGHVGLHVIAYDDDRVESHNVGRQNFTPHDIGEFKSTCLISKINRAFNLLWEGVPCRASFNHYDLASNIIISCTDSSKSRIELADYLKFQTKAMAEYSTIYYWLDMGNTRDTGQFILGTVCEDQTQDNINGYNIVTKLKNVLEVFPNLETNDTEVIQGAGCSYKDKLNEQSLFINDVLTSHASDLIFNCLYHKEISAQGGFVNLSSGHVRPLKIAQQQELKITA